VTPQQKETTRFSEELIKKIDVDVASMVGSRALRFVGPITEKVS
jgi:hypothetical protein